MTSTSRGRIAPAGPPACIDKDAAELARMDCRVPGLWRPGPVGRMAAGQVVAETSGRELLCRVAIAACDGEARSRSAASLIAAA